MRSDLKLWRVGAYITIVCSVISTVALVRIALKKK